MARILVAEDEGDIRDLVVLSLRFEGYEVIEAKNGEEAVRAAHQIPVDLILMDVRMPRMTGYEACIELKSDERTKDIPIIILSAKGQEADVKRGLDVGAEEYVLKPFAPDELNEHVSRVLARFGKGSLGAIGQNG
jgi:DNA-binding response OmpR family regulator